MAIKIALGIMLAGALVSSASLFGLGFVIGVVACFMEKKGGRA